MPSKQRGILFIVSGPSGAGKGTLCAKLLKENSNIHFSVSATTRPCRENEIPGKSYHFISDSEYETLLQSDAFLEHAYVHKHRYGTLKAEVCGYLDKGMHVLLDIDTVGALNIMSHDIDCVSVFMLPPSYAALRERLLARNTDNSDDIALRINNAQAEIDKIDRYHYVIINDDVDLAYHALKAIVTAEQHSTKRYLPMVPNI